MASVNCIPLFIYLLVFTCTRCSFATETTKSPKEHARKLIRELNLLTKHDSKIIAGNSVLKQTEPRIIEKRLVLSPLGDAGSTVQDLAQHAGYYQLPYSRDARMFYFFFESRSSKDDPVVIWLTGGPGCASEIALFNENGPFNILENMTLKWNDFGWDKVSNIIFVDQPIGTGFSYSSFEDDTPTDEEGIGNDLYDFLQAFFEEHPDYTKNDFYITGESYAGHYIPAFASRVHKGNNRGEGIHINLKGFAIGNGLTDPAIQYNAYKDYALDMKLINQSDAELLKPAVSECLQFIGRCGPDGGQPCRDAFHECSGMVQEIVALAGGMDVYDIRKKSPPSIPDFSNVEKFLNLEPVRAALGVGDIKFKACNGEVYRKLITDWMQNLEEDIPNLLEDGIRVLIYAGEYDFICNWLGNSRWVHAMEWSGQTQFAAAPMVPFTVDGVVAGLAKSYGPLTFLKVHDAGHMVPKDQPKASLEMLLKWMQSKLPSIQRESRLDDKQFNPTT